MKFSMKRLAAFVLALVMVLGLFPVMNNTANAIDVTGLTDSSIGVKYVISNNPGSAAGCTVNSGNSLTAVTSGKVLGANYMNTKNTITITNNKTTKAKLSFDFELSGVFGTVKIDTTTYSSATTDSFEKELAAGASVTIVMTAKRQKESAGPNDLTMKITNLSLTIVGGGPVTTTFEAPANGSYTVAYGEESLTVAAGTVSQSVTNLPSVQYTLTADPGEGYKLVGWYNVTSGQYLTTASTFVGSFEENGTIKAIVVPADSAVFMTGGQYFTDLNEAVTYAQSKSEKQVTLVQSGILNAGSYTIPAGITLLIPKDSDYSVTRTDDPDFFVNPEYGTEVATPYAFMTLTMAEGAELIVNGTLDIESKHTTLQGSGAARPYGGRVCGPYGAISMSPDSSIVVNSGAILFAFGYVYGNGTINAKSGAKVYEIMQVTDFPGGSNMAGFVDSDLEYDLDTPDWPADTNPTNDYIKTFPFSQYYVQNIEVALTLNAGASEYVYISMTAADMSKGLAVEFVGKGGMFNPGENGYIVKDYDPSTDRLNVSVYGDASMAGIALDMTGTSFEAAMKEFLGISKVDSATFILTLNSNISINIVSGTTTVKQDLSLLPGVEITVGKDATLVIAQRTYADDEYDNLTIYGSGGYNIYVWDAENWGNFVFSHVPMVALSYSPTTGRYVRVKADLKDVKLDINGTIVCEGYLYSTVTADDETWEALSGGAQVISSGKTGKLVLQNGAGWEDLAYCLDGSSSCDSGMFIDSVWLQNGDGSYVLTDGAEAGTTYNYCDVHDLWYTEGHGDCVVINTVEITWIVNGEGAPEEYLLGATPSYKGSTPTKPANGCTVYTFAGWATIPNGEVLTSLPAVTGEATYFAIFTEAESHSWVDADCENNGYCANCGAAGDAAIGHDWVDPDCENDGYCVNCGEPGEAALGHELFYECDNVCCICYKILFPESNHDRIYDCDTQCRYCRSIIWPDATCESDADHLCEDGNCIWCGDPVAATEPHDWVDPTCEDDGYCLNCGAAGEAALGHGTIGWEYVQVDNDVHQVWCKDCYSYTYNDGHDYVSHVCRECGWTEQMSVKFYNGDTLWSEINCEYNKTLGIAGMPIPEAPTGYKFAGWYTADGVSVAHGMTVTEDIVAYAKFAVNTYNITFRVNGVTSNVVPVTYGTQITQQWLMSHGVCNLAGYSLRGWTVTYSIKQTPNNYNFSMPAQDFYADAILEINTYTVTWIAGGVTTTETYEYGATPSFKGSTDKASDGCTDYTFTGWDKGIAPVIGNVTYTAQYSQSKSHEWDDATCTAPKTCSVCSATEGDPLGHSWNAADCENAKTCSVCGATEGDPLGHSWKAADCENAKTCSVCGATEGEALGHKWQNLYSDYNGDNTHTDTYECQRCFDTYTEDDDCSNGSDGYVHECDVCFGELTICEDADKDHYCDTPGCGNELSSCEDGNDEDHDCDYAGCDKTNVDRGCHGGTAYCNAKAVCDECGEEYGDFNADNHASTKLVYGDVTKTTHNEYYACCPTVLKSANVEHDYTYNTRYHKCQCGAVEEFKLTVVYGVNGEYTFEAMLPYWTPMNSLDVINNIPWRIYVNNDTHMGYFYLDDYYWDMDHDGDLDRDRYFTEGYMPGYDLYVEARYDFNGFVHDGNGWKYRNYGRFYTDYLVVVTSSMISENGSDEEIVGIYMVGADGYRIENGMGRWNYLGNMIDGVTYEPNAEDIAYYENKGQTFIDKEKTWYYFGDDGKLAFDYTGLVGDSYVINGQAAWHIGLVEIDGEYYYFKGDEVNGGNIMVTGDYYVSRNNTTFNMVVGGIYTFDNDGVMQLFHGITESELFEGKRHYIGGRLTPGLGLVDLVTGATGEVRYFYVDSYGQLILDAEYYIGANSFGLTKGIYYFDAEGFLVIPEPEVGKSGLFFEDGKWYYYVDGAKAYCAGLIEIDGNWVYVKSDGSLATGMYYVTNVNGHETIASGTKCLFDENGVMQEALNGIIDGVYYVNNSIAYAAGLVETEDGYIYVKSNGQIVTNTQYWITNVNDTGVEPGYYQFDENGIMAPAFTGVKDGCYYENGAIAYAAGLVEIEPGKYVYVRSNGEVATGMYWITNHNGLLPEGFYDFGEDGYLTVN